MAANEREDREWTRTASVLTMLANINRDHKKRRTPYKVDDFHPMRRPKKSGVPLTSETVGMLKVFLRPENLRAPKLHKPG